MKTTERKHWLNGHDVRGGWFHTWAWTDDTFGVLFMYGINRFRPHVSIKIFKLV